MIAHRFRVFVPVVLAVFVAACATEQLPKSRSDANAELLLKQGHDLCNEIVHDPKHGGDLAAKIGWTQVPAPVSAANMREAGWTIFQFGPAEITAWPVNYVHMQGWQCIVAVRGQSLDFTWLRTLDGLSEGTHLNVDEPSKSAELSQLSSVKDGFVTTIRAQRQNFDSPSTQISMVRFRIIDDGLKDGDQDD